MPSSPTPSNIKAVLFDYGMVLTAGPHPPAWEHMKSILHAHESAFHAAYWRYRHAYDCGTLNGPAYWQQVAHDLGRTLDDHTANALIDADTELWTQPNPPMIDWAAALQAAGVRTGILSNLGDALQAGVMTRCPWLNRFDHLTFSHRLGTAKPDLAIYLHAAAGLGVEPAQVLFIDDREDNIRGAREAGMHVMHYTDHASFVREMRSAGLEPLLAHATKV